MSSSPASSEFSQDDSRRLVVIQRNPGSGSGRRSGIRELLKLIKELRRMDFRIRMFSRRALLDQYVALPDVVRELRCIVAAGGDGTAADLINRHPRIPVALLPLGTENLLARYLGVRHSGRQVAEIIERGRIRELDCGMFDGNRFLLMLSAGVDAQIVRQLHAVRTGHIHYASYLWPIVRGLCGYRPMQIEAASSSRAQVVRGTHVLISNVPVYGFGFRFSPEAVPHDGLLDVRVFHGTTRLATLWHAICVWFGWQFDERQVTRFRTDQLTLVPGVAGGAAGEITDSSGIPVQFDGDPGPSLPLRVWIDSSSVRVLVPL